MTKTKRQLRAEAVERLRECRYHTLADYVRAMLGWGHEPHFEDSRDALIDLLTDEEPPEGDVISKKAVREIIERHFNRVPIVDDGSGKPIEWRDDLVCNVGFDFSSIVDEIADMVERDYVRRIDLEAKDAEVADLRDERDRMKADYERIYQFQEVETERNHWKSNAERYKAERDEWKAKAETRNDGAGRSVTNLDWLMENDFEALQNQMGGQPCSCCMVGCEEDLGSDEACDAALREWLLSPHVDDNDGDVAQDTREKINALRAHYGAGPTKMTDEQIEAGREAYGAKKELDMVIIDELADTREKLEADTRVLLGWVADSAVAWGDADAAVRYFIADAIRMLNRQAAITERHWMEIVGASTNANVELKRQIDERQARVDELTEQLEAAHAKNRSLRTHISKMQDGRHGWHVKGVELQREVDRLTSENISLARDLGECMAERDSWRYRWHQVRVLMDEPLQCNRATLVDIDGEVVG